MIVRINYTNWKGDTRERLVLPHRIWFGKTDWHPDYQWLLHAEDLDKHEERDFALVNVHSWQRVEYSELPGNIIV